MAPPTGHISKSALVRLRSKTRTDSLIDPNVVSPFPFGTPTRDNVQIGAKSLFPETITDEELEYRHQRFQLVKVIVDNVTEDSLRNGFIVYPIKPDGEAPSQQEIADLDNKFQAVYNRYIRAPYLKATKFCRLYGASFLYFAYKDNGQELSTPVTSFDAEGNYLPKIGSIVPIKLKDVEMQLTDTLPRNFVNISINFGDNNKLGIDPSRFVHLENEGINYDKKGVSCLEPVWNLLTVQVHADWAIGQGFWRGFTGLLCVTSPDGAESTDAVNAADAITDLSSKTRLVLPPGWDAKDVSPTRMNFPIKDAYELIILQIAAGTRIPAAVFSPGMKELASEEYEGFLYSYQEGFHTPNLARIFRKFQKSGQLPEGDFDIAWFAKAGNPYESSKTQYLRVLSETLSRKNQMDQIGAVPSGTPTSISNAAVSALEANTKSSAATTLVEKFEATKNVPEKNTTQEVTRAKVVNVSNIQPLTEKPARNVVKSSSV